jgi:LmbE family N-acetylglucosaminyl deacetylase
MLTLKLPQDAKSPLEVLCLGAHADDIEIGCGGTILRLLSQNYNLKVTWVVFSASKEREREARQSASLFLDQAKQKEIIVNDFRDGYFPFDGAKIKDFFEGLKRISPGLIFTHNGRDAHQDHRLISQLTWNTFRDHMICEYEIPKYDGDMGKPNLFIPLDSEICQKKVHNIMEMFPSQHKKRWFQQDTFSSLMKLRGMECNAPSGFAEAFYCRKVVV